MRKLLAAASRPEVGFAVVAVSVAAVVALAALTGCSGGSGSSYTQLAQPEDARQVAAQIGATGFTDDGAAEIYVLDSGTAMYHGRKIGIDTFADGQGRDDWLKVAEDYGVSPLLEGGNWVAYWSVDGS